MVEGEWGEGKRLKFKDCDGDWLKMKNNDDVVEVWNQTKSGVVTLKVSQQNQVNFVVLSYFILFYFILFYFILFCFVLFCFFGFVFALLLIFFFFFFFLVIIFIITAHDQLFFLDSNFFHHTDSIYWCLFCHLIFSGECFSFFFFLFLSFSFSFFFFLFFFLFFDPLILLMIKEDYSLLFFS